MAVGARRIVRQARLAIGDRGEQGVAVRDRLVARDSDAAAQAPGGRHRRRRRGWHRQHLTVFLARSAPGANARGSLTSRRDGLVFRGSMAGQRSLRLEFTSAFEMLDLVQVVSDHVGRDVGLDDDAVHWVGVAIRESVINAIKHGNQNDAGKRVFVDFETASDAGAGRTQHPGARPGAGIRPRSPRRSAGARKPPEGQRPRHLPHSQLHGRRHPPARSRGRHGDPHDQARAAGRVTPRPALPHHRHRSGRPRRRRHDVALRHRRPHRQEGHHRPRHRGGRRHRAQLPRR